MSGRQPPPPPPPPPPKDDKRGGGGKGTRDERPLFEALYVVSVEGGVPDDDTIPPRSSVEAYERANRRSQPRVIWRFPPKLPAGGVGASDDLCVREEDVLRFCFPDKEAIRPVRPEKFVAGEFVFVVTDSKGAKAYGFCRRVLPCGPGGRYDTGRLRLPECLCLVSRRPFFSIFNSVLATGQAFRLLQQTPPILQRRTPHENAVNADWRSSSDGVGSVSDWNSSGGIPCPPGGEKLEGLLTQLLAGGERGGGVPGPGQELVACGLRFVRPVDEHMSLNDVPVTPLLVRLAPRNFLRLWSAILCERRIVLVADDVRTLSACVHAASAMLYPFAWQHVFIPLLPSDMLEYVTAPMPFVIGVRTSQLEAVKRQPMDEAVFVHLDRGEVTGSVGMTPVPDICDGVKENLASASKKLDRALGKLALLTRSSKDGQERGPREERDWGGKAREGINDTASALFADVKAIYGKAKKTKQGLGSTVATPEDHALRAALLAFNVGLFGDHRTILRMHSDGGLKVDHGFFIRHRREKRGDSEGVLRFLDEFLQSQMFHMHTLHVKDRLLSRPKSTPGGGDNTHPSPATFMRISDLLMKTSSADGAGDFSTASVKRTLHKVLADALPAGYSTNAYGDPTLNPLALEVTSNTPMKKDATKARAELCRLARDTATLGGIMRAVWTRLSDCRGSKWRHATEGLRLLKALLLSGPESCLADALSHVPAVRRLTRYPKDHESAGSGGGGGGGGGSKGWEEVLVGGGDNAQAGARVRTMAREVVCLMMDVKRLALRRVALVALKQKKSERNASTDLDGKPEKIKLRSRYMPDFHTLHGLLGQSSSGASLPGGAGGLDGSNDGDSLATGQLFSGRPISIGGESDNGSQFGLQGLGDEVDGRAWPDWAATLSRITGKDGGGDGGGGAGEEDSSDGDEGLNIEQDLADRPSPPPLPLLPPSLAGRERVPSPPAPDYLTNYPADLVTEPVPESTKSDTSNSTHVQPQGVVALDDNGFPIYPRPSTSSPPPPPPPPPPPAQPSPPPPPAGSAMRWDVVPSASPTLSSSAVSDHHEKGFRHQALDNSSPSAQRHSQPPPPPPPPPLRTSSSETRASSSPYPMPAPASSTNPTVASLKPSHLFGSRRTPAVTIPVRTSSVGAGSGARTGRERQGGSGGIRTGGAKGSVGGLVGRFEQLSSSPVSRSQPEPRGVSSLAASPFGSPAGSPPALSAHSFVVGQKSSPQPQRPDVVATQVGSPPSRAQGFEQAKQFGVSRSPAMGAGGFQPPLQVHAQVRSQQIPSQVYQHEQGFQQVPPTPEAAGQVQQQQQQQQPGVCRLQQDMPRYPQLHPTQHQVVQQQGQTTHQWDGGNTPSWQQQQQQQQQPPHPRPQQQHQWPHQQEQQQQHIYQQQTPHNSSVAYTGQTGYSSATGQGLSSDGFPIQLRQPQQPQQPQRPQNQQGRNSGGGGNNNGGPGWPEEDPFAGL